MNVIEYVKEPKKCIESALDKTRRCLILCTDMTNDGPTYFPAMSHFMKQLWVFNLAELLRWIPFPKIMWIYDTTNPHPCRYQVFIAAFKFLKDLEKIDKTNPTFDPNFEISETQKDRNK
jgi:hypothetical protein